MAILHPEEIRDMTPAERQVELEELETELLNMKSLKATGGMLESPGRMRELKRTIARVKTIQQEEGDFEEGEETIGADADEAAASEDIAE